MYTRQVSKKAYQIDPMKHTFSTYLTPDTDILG